MKYVMSICFIIITIISCSGRYQLKKKNPELFSKIVGNYYILSKINFGQTIEAFSLTENGKLIPLQQSSKTNVFDPDSNERYGIGDSWDAFIEDNGDIEVLIMKDGTRISRFKILNNSMLVNKNEADYQPYRKYNIYYLFKKVKYIGSRPYVSSIDDLSTIRREYNKLSSIISRQHGINIDKVHNSNLYLKASEDESNKGNSYLSDKNKLASNSLLDEVFQINKIIHIKNNFIVFKSRNQERDLVSKDMILALYPEIGFHYLNSDGIRLTVT